jgi:hypothetical protein
MENVTNTNNSSVSMENTNGSIKPKSKIWRVVKKAIIVIVIFYAILVIWRTFVLVDNDRTAEKVKEIHTIRLTMSDVDGSILPPMPDMALNDSTVEGVDVNKNYVRDDVERWIFDTYPDIRERAAWMQQAKAKNLVMLKADSKLTLKAIMEEESRSNICGVNTYRAIDPKFTDYNQKESLVMFKVANNDIRKLAMDRGYSFMTSSGPMNGNQCDVFNDVK